MPFLRSMKHDSVHSDTQTRQHDRAQKPLQLFHGAFFPATEVLKILTSIAMREGVQRFMQECPPANFFRGKTSVNQNVAVKWLLSFEAGIFDQGDFAAPI